MIPAQSAPASASASAAPPRAAPGKIVFANQLRGLAALCVVLVHYTVVYQYMQPMLGWALAMPAVPGVPAPWATWFYPWWLDLGAFGVALFFLISGFVIPFSLHRATRGGFLLARTLRILPTYWAALLVEWAVVGGFSRYWGKPVVFDRATFLANAVLIHTAIGGLGVDFVNWSLVIEVKFYLLMALLRPFVVRARVGPLLLCAAGALVFCALEGQGALCLPPQLASEAAFLVFMLVGTLFHYHLAGAVRARRLVLAGAALLAAGALCWRLGPDGVNFPRKSLNYGYALAVFAGCYALRARFRPLQLLDLAAAVSYPLYLVHSLVGFSLMTYAILAWHVPYAVAAPGAFAVVVLVAWTLHATVERAGIAAGRRLAAASVTARTMWPRGTGFVAPPRSPLADPAPDLD